MKDTSEIPCRVSGEQARRKKLTHIGEALKQKGDIEGSRSRNRLDPVTTDSLVDLSAKMRGMRNIPNTSVLQEMGWYLSGYSDGEGSFCISFSPRSKLRIGLEVRPSFSVSQNGDRSEVLRLFQQTFDCGTIRPDRSDKTFKFETRNLRNLIDKVIPFFERFPLKSSKMKDFELFSQVCLMMDKGEHNEKSGLIKIVQLATQMNSSGKRKYSKRDLINFLQ